MEGVTIHIWDLPLRLFHWLLVVTIVASYIATELGGLWLEWHSHFGVFTLALIVFRIAWGFLGSTYARFSSFVPTPARLHIFFSSKWSAVGHNPLGALSVFALLGLILIQSGLGLFAVNDEIDFHGPLYDLVNAAWSDLLTSWHAQGFNALLLLIGLHVSAIVYYAWLKHQNLILPMITGRTNVANNTVIHPIRGGGKIQLLISVAIAGWVFWSIESGALLRWLSPMQPAPHQTTVPK